MADTKFKPGTPKPANSGRKKGTLNKKTVELMAVLEEKGFNVAEELMWCYERAKAIAQYRAKKGNLAGALVAIGLAADVAGDIAQYVFPKKKAIEHSGEVGVKTFADFMAAGEPEENK